MTLLGRVARDAMARLMAPPAAPAADDDCAGACPCRLPVGDEIDEQIKTEDDDDG